MLNPRLIDFKEESHGIVSSSPIWATSVVDIQSPNILKYVQPAK